jgi:hypothetical protein
MAEAWFDARRTGGVVFLGWVYENARTLLANCAVLVNSHDGPFDSTEPNLAHPRFETSVRLTSRLAPELARGREPALFAAVNGGELSTVQPIRRIEVVTSEHPLMTQILETELECNDVERFEVLMHMRGLNLNQPKSLFRR